MEHKGKKSVKRLVPNISKEALEKTKKLLKEVCSNIDKLIGKIVSN